MAATYTCCECGEIRSGTPAERMPIDEKVRLVFTERAEGEVIDILAQFGGSLGAPQNGLYEMCPECKADREWQLDVE